ncbi:unnamed protein product [Protopolystoma xenopodis]|uniref:Uncharacterized protein n=1 Tax=Protopolystoma xenopodis TaxID=117903 RepID=A0A448XK13_9PLAT|nr:unnamed protein product [Protopolystoma xenopodis]
MFADVCEYRVQSSAASLQADASNSQVDGVSSDGTSKSAGTPVVLPYPPTSQSSYGPTEKAVEFGLATLPRRLEPVLRCSNGILDVRFTAAESVGAGVCKSWRFV